MAEGSASVTHERAASTDEPLPLTGIELCLVALVPIWVAEIRM